MTVDKLSGPIKLEVESLKNQTKIIVDGENNIDYRYVWN